MEFVVRKVTKSRNDGFIVTLDHEDFVDTSLGKQRRFKSYSTKVWDEEPPEIGEKKKIDFSLYDIVPRPFIDENGEERFKNWLHLKN